jgi:hypothetical protein
MPVNERRAMSRNRILRGAKILVNNRSVIDCAVRDLTDEGACLQVASPVGIPLSFDLLIKGESASRPCDLVWKSAGRIGVSFHRAPASGQSAASRSAA